MCGMILEEIKKGLLNGDVAGTDEKDDNINGDGALTFDGNGDYVHVNHSADFNIGSNNFVISSLIKTSSEETDLIICSKTQADNNGFSFYLSGAGLLTFSVWDNSANAIIYYVNGDDLRDDDSHYVAVEIFQNTASIYNVDPFSGSYGEVEEYVDFPQDPGDNTNPFYIGKKDTSYFEGDIEYSLYFYTLETSFSLNPPYPANRDRMWGLENVCYLSMDEGLIEECS